MFSLAGAAEPSVILAQSARAMQEAAKRPNGRLGRLEQRQRPRGRSWRGTRGQVQTREDGDNDRGIFDRGNDLERAGAVWAVLDVDGEHALAQARPAQARWGRRGMIGAGLRVMICGRRYDSGAQLGVRSEHAVEADQVQAGTRYQGRQALPELRDDDAGSFGPIDHAQARHTRERAGIARDEGSATRKRGCRDQGVHRPDPLASLFEK